MKKFYKNSQKYVLLSLISMSFVLQSCKVEGNQDIIPAVKHLPGASLKINQGDTENPENHRHRSRPIEGMKFTGKREREKGKQETSLVQTQAKPKRRKLERSEDENVFFHMNLITFFKAISESNKARTAVKEEVKRVRKEVTSHIPQSHLT